MIDYKAGKRYILKKAIKVRSKPSVNSPQKYTAELVGADKQNAYDQLFAVLKPDTKIVAMKVIRENGETWIKIPSGFILAQTAKETYIV